MEKQEGCFRCPLLTSWAAALKKAPCYSCCPTASRAASRELIFIHIYSIFTQPRPSAAWASLWAPAQPGGAGQGGFTAQRCSCPRPTTASARREPDKATRQPPPSLPLLTGLFWEGINGSGGIGVGIGPCSHLLHLQVHHCLEDVCYQQGDAGDEQRHGNDPHGDEAQRLHGCCRGGTQAPPPLPQPPPGSGPGAGGGRPPRPACRRAGRSCRRRGVCRPARRGGSRRWGAASPRPEAGWERGEGGTSPKGTFCYPGLAGPCSVHQAGRRTLLTREEKNVSENNLVLFLFARRAPAGTAEVFLFAVDGSASARLLMQQASVKGFLENKQKTSYSSARWLGKNLYRTQTASRLN